jgi:hypothetical protein
MAQTAVKVKERSDENSEFLQEILHILTEKDIQ